MSHNRSSNSSSNSNKGRHRKVLLTNQFKRDLKKRYLELLTSEWVEVFSYLTKGDVLPEKYRDHALTGSWQGCRDCHVKPDLLLIYRVNGDTLELVRFNSHAEVFG